MRFRDKQEDLLSLVSSHFPPHKLHSALDDAKVGVIICDRQFRYKAVNQSIAEIHNVPVNAILGQSFHQALGNLAEKVVPFWENVFTTGQPLTYFEVAGRLPMRADAARWIEKVFPLRDGKGQIKHVGGFIIEISPPPVPTSLPSIPIRKEPTMAGHPQSRATRDWHPVLSQREQEVLRLLAEGKSSKEISSALAISVRTVETYRVRLMLKVNANSIADLVRYAIRNHIIPI